MNHGISMVEVMVVATLTLLLAVVVTQAIQAGAQVARHQDVYRGRQEEIFMTVDTLRCDLARCGSYLQPLARNGAFLPVLVMPSGEGWLLLRGEYRMDLSAPLAAGNREVAGAWDPGFWAAGDELLLADPDGLQWEEHRVASLEGGRMELVEPSRREWPIGTRALKLMRIQYQWDSRSHRLSRGVNGGARHTLMEDVSYFDMEVRINPWAVAYCLECGQRERVQGFVLLPQMDRPGLAQ